MNPARFLRARACAQLVVATIAFAFAAPALAADHGLSRADLDTTVSPCQDFYRYANGGWIARTAIPAAYGRYGGFEELADRNLDNVHRMLEEIAAARGSMDHDRTLLARFYGSCMDSVTAEREGDRPIRPAVAAIDRIPPTGGAAATRFAEMVAELHAQGVPVLFLFSGTADPGNSEMVIATAGQGGLGLPDRDYYFRTDPASVRIRTEYLAHMARSLQLIGVPAADAARQAERVMAIETALAGASMTRVQMRDPRATYHRMKFAELVKLCPGFDWKDYLAAAGVPRIEHVNVRQPEFFTGLDSLRRAVPTEDWKAYLRWHTVRDASPLLSQAFVDENFRFQRVLTGVGQMQPRWRRCLEATDRALGHPLGRVYVERHFTPETRARALEMVTNLKAALRDRITQLAWMSEATRQQALRKLDAMGLKIGYPDKWRDFSGLSLERGAFATHSAQAARFERAYRLGRIGKPVDKGEFSMTPPTVNARYSASLNDILFPAGILQPPFFDPEADDAVNYGGIGMVIGHEMTHGFDDSGRRFDATGNLKDWWTADDARQYQSRADRIIAQYDAYTVLDTVRVNGRLTTGENISDLGGLTVAYAALQKALENKRVPLIDGFTPEQRFFLAYARIWRQVIRPEEARRRIATDSHSPGVWRVNGPLSNMAEFHQAFGCRPGDVMVRDEADRTAIW